MTAAEKRKMRRLEIRVEELEKALDEALDSRNKNFRDSFEACYAMRCAVEAIREGLDIMENSGRME